MKFKFRGRRYTWHPPILIKNLVQVVSVILLVWFMLSYTQILIHNVDGLNGPAYDYPIYNFFVFVSKVCGK